MVWDKGFNFRATSGYVTDGPDETYSVNGNYPETRNGVTFGWNAVATDLRDRDNTLDRRLAGIVFGNNLGVFRVDLPAAGEYDIRIAMGDGTGGQTNMNMDIRDTTTTVLSIGPDADTGGAEYYDATSVLRTAAAWPGANVAVRRTFATTICNVHLLAAESNTTIAHLFLSQVVVGGGSTLLRLHHLFNLGLRPRPFAPGGKAR